jgi:L-cystine uptake protein TcyP (sodium:dicarboxylate symporter family)
MEKRYGIISLVLCFVVISACICIDKTLSLSDKVLSATFFGFFDFFGVAFLQLYSNQEADESKKNLNQQPQA